MFSKILVATDLSPASDRLIAGLGSLKPLGARDVLLVHVLNLRDVGTMAESLAETAKPLLRTQKEIVEGLGFQADFIIALGLPHIEINRIAEERDRSLIVVGSHGETLAREILLGSVASAALHHMIRPTLVMKIPLRLVDGETVCDEIRCNPMGNILFPTDFSENAEQAFSAVRDIVRSGAKRATLFHVQDQVMIGQHLLDRLEEFNHIDTERLERLKAILREEGTRDIHIELAYGSPKQKIIERIRKGDVSLVAMGSQGRGFIKELFLGSVSHAVARFSEAPTLLIPSKR